MQDAPEHSLERRSAAVLRLGSMLLAAGAGSYRVKDSMRRAAHALGLHQHRAQVTLTEITTTARDGEQVRTEVVEQREVGVNADRIDALAGVVERLRPGRPVSELEEALGRAERTPPRYGAVLNALAVALACAAFAFLNNGGPIVCAAVLVAAGLGQTVRRRMQHARLNKFAITALAAALSSSVYVGIVLGLERLDVADASHEAGLISAVLYLVPGFPLVTGVLDLVRMDLSAGVARLAYVTVTLLSAGMSVWAVSWVAALELDGTTTTALAGPLLLALRVVASAVAAAGFAMLFNSTPRAACVAAVIGGIANPARISLVEAGVAPQAASLAAACVIGLLAALAASRGRASRVTLSVPAVVIMVPGVMIYRSLVHLNEGEVAQALGNGVEATFVVMGLGVGLAVARMLTDKNWAFDR
ncbi:threonine/serine exporter family protein [Georgenia satyanarayanai]|uniref:threonine/serine ThrE exporter family protein n=1 Tax=Georgenia satyanarayanai TaxID=860221 RepID=UPI002040784E|nr:threonine/serine exporter family protein [Georgenia satyanarayanai]MCM3661269.1 threonine/serine exporter family protein [Georgenia satyanarayanai]